MGDRRAALRHPLAPQLGPRRLHRPRKLDRHRRRARRRGDRAQSAACPVRRPARRGQPVFSEQPAFPQSALHRRRGRSRVSASSAGAISKRDRSAPGTGPRRLRRRREHQGGGAGAGLRQFLFARQRRAPAAVRCVPAPARTAACGVRRIRIAAPALQTALVGMADEWRKPDPDALARLRAEYADELAFVEYMQWVADQQLAACRDRARHAGLADRALSRPRGRRPAGRLRRLERAGFLPAEDRDRRAAGRAQHARPALGPGRRQSSSS